MISPIFVSQILNIFLLLATVLSIGLGLFVWWQNKKSSLHISFALLSVSIVIWLSGSYMMLNNCGQEKLVVFWDRFLYLAAMFIPVFFYHFCLGLAGRTEEQRHKSILVIGYIIAFLFLLLSRTDYFVKGVFHYKWGCHTIAQPGHHLFLVFFSFYILLSLYLLYDTWKRTKNPVLRIQAKYTFVSFILLIPTSVELLPAYKIGVFPFGYFFPLIWLLILAYTITRYKLLNIKVIATDILIAGVVFVVLAFTILSENSLQFIGRGIFLILVVIFGWLAIRGVHREVDEKERLEEKVQERTKELKKSYEEIKKRKEDLEHFYKLTVGRELKMIELKKKIKEMEEKPKR